MSHFLPVLCCLILGRASWEQQAPDWNFSYEMCSSVESKMTAILLFPIRKAAAIKRMWR